MTKNTFDIEKYIVRRDKSKYHNGIYLIIKQHSLCYNKVQKL